MNTKQSSGVLKQFSFIKLVNILVILSMVLTSCGGVPEKHVANGISHKLRN